MICVQREDASSGERREGEPAAAPRNLTSVGRDRVVTRGWLKSVRIDGSPVDVVCLWCLRARLQYGAGASPARRIVAVEHVDQTRLLLRLRGRRQLVSSRERWRSVETIVERAAGLDVHKAQVTACVLLPGRGRRRQEELAEFPTTVRGLLALRDWFQAYRVTQVAMEATGVYWKPVWAILEDDFDCLLCNARHVKQVPGRKTDVSDAAWLCQLLEAGLLQRSFVPPKPIRALRNLTRYRKAQIGERQREANRLHKILEDTGIKRSEERR